MSSDTDLPSLDEIFSKAKRAKPASVVSQEKENSVGFYSDLSLEDGQVENRKSNKAETFFSSTKRVKRVLVSHFLLERKRSEKPIPPNSVRKEAASKPEALSLKENTAAFVYCHYRQIHLPALVLGPSADTDRFFRVKFYDGDEDAAVSRKYIFTPEDESFFTIPIMSLSEIKPAGRKFCKYDLIRLVERHKSTLIEVLRGDLVSNRDEVFRKGLQRRAGLNAENRAGPLSPDEYTFLLEYFPDILLQDILMSDEELEPVLEERFGRSGDSLRHELRQYSYLVLIPEFIVRVILERGDQNVETLAAAEERYLNYSDDFDENGNFIRYLYSKREMYNYARRDRSG